MIYSHPDFSVQPIHAQLHDDSLMACFNKGRILISALRGHKTLPTWAELRKYWPAHETPFELAHVEKTAIFSVHPFRDCTIPESEGLQYENANVFRTLPFHDAALITTSRHLWTWYQQNRFCGSCGSLLAPDDQERALRCAKCGRMVFPTICPAVITAITSGEKILLVKTHNHPTGAYSLVAGYVEVGETLEHTVRREAMEEVGLELHNLRYLGDQPWGIGGSHMFAFHAEADDTQPIRIQESELLEARWFHRSELAPSEHTVSIAFELIERFRKGIL